MKNNPLLTYIGKKTRLANCHALDNYVLKEN
jgi:hypothetical protein